MAEISKEIISSFSSREEFIKLLHVNPGLVIVKLGATWCGPCKQIKPVVDAFFASSPKNVICADIDVDDSVDLYAFLKSKKMVNGIPVMLCYIKGNVSFAPNDAITGSDPTQLSAFFKRCGNYLAALDKLEMTQNKTI